MKVTAKTPPKALLVLLLLMSGLLFGGCSTSSNLRKFTDDNIQKEIPAELAKKFEVKDEKNSEKVENKSQKSVEKKAEKKAAKKLKSMSPPSANNPPVRKIDPMPFGVGEILEYDIRFIGVNAGSFRMEVKPLKVVNERTVYHISGHATTTSIFSLVYRVEDQVDSYIDESGIYSHRFTMDLDESKQTRKVIELFDYEKKKSFYWNRVDSVDKGYREVKEEHDIQLWSQDPLSTLYFARVAPLPTDTSREYKFPLVLDGKPWECIVKFTGVEKIYAGSKYFEADTYTIDAYQDGQLKNQGNKVWISRDEHRYVLRIEAKLRVGSFAVALEKIL